MHQTIAIALPLDIDIIITCEHLAQQDVCDIDNPMMNQRHVDFHDKGASLQEG